MKRVAILGPGLLGGSIALKLKEIEGMHVSLWARREEAIAQIHARNCADTASLNLGEVVQDAELVVICVPVGMMVPLAEKLRPLVRKDAVITDVGSVKQQVVLDLDRVFEGHGRFVGSHPMAGSEKTGLDAANADLFAGATCIVTPAEKTDPDAVDLVGGFWKLLGCGKVCYLSPQVHDECVALVSHLPHLLAAALVNTVAELHAEAFEVVGPGFRDTTRVASGPSLMWKEILVENSQAVVRSMDAMIAKLSAFRQTLASASRKDAIGEIGSFLESAQSTRDKVFPKNR